MFGISTYEFLIIAVVAVLVLGPEHLPGVIRTATRIMSDFRRISTEFQRAINLDFPLPPESPSRNKVRADAKQEAPAPFQDGSAPELNLAATAAADPAPTADPTPAAESAPMADPTPAAEAAPMADPAADFTPAAETAAGEAEKASPDARRLFGREPSSVQDKDHG